MYAAQQAAVQRALHGRGVTAVSVEWLAACLTFLEESCGGARLSPTTLHDQVLHQWLDTDLSVIGVAVLPARLAEAAVTTLRGPLALQLLDCVDVGQPAHAQLLRLRRLDSANTQVGEPPAAGWEPKPSRALRLTLTDGVQTVVGLEYRPIGALRPDLAPGAKLLLRGEVECRRGVLLLTADAVEVLGGSVDDLQQPQHEQRALERRLGDAAAVVPAARDETAVYVPQRPARQTVSHSAPAVAVWPTYAGEYSAASGVGADLAPAAGISTAVLDTDPFDDGIDDDDLAAVAFDDDIDDAELASLDEPDVGADVEPAAPQPVKRPRPDIWQPPVRDAGRSDPVRSFAANSAARHERPAPGQQRLDVFLRSSLSVARPPPTAAVPPWSGREAAGDAPPWRAPLIKQEPNTETLVTAGASRQTTATALCGSTETSLAWQTPPASSQRSPAAAVRPPPSIEPAPWSGLADDLLSLTSPEPPEPAPFQYLSQLRPGAAGGVTAKVFIMTQTSKLSMVGGGWSLAVKINDGCSALEASLSDAVLTRLIGLSAAEVAALKGRPEARQRLRAALDTAQRAIIHLSCLAHVQMVADGGATITELREVTEETLRRLRRAVAAS